METKTSIIDAMNAAIDAGYFKPVTSVIGSQFEYKGKIYTVINVESNGVIAKINEEPNSPVNLILPIDLFNKITGNNISAPPLKTREEYAKLNVIKNAEAIKFIGGQK